MNESHPLLSHQVDVVRKLALNFRKITVLTAEGSSALLPENVVVIDLRWKPKKPISNSLTFLTKLNYVLKYDRPDVVFSHMTDVQSSLASPLLRIKAIPHFLWYAHKSKSGYLKFSNLFVSKILTSTRGSCPLVGPKIEIIGQAIDFDHFYQQPRDIPIRNKWVHLGRSDPSKGIAIILETFSQMIESHENLTLTFIGNASTIKFNNDLNLLKVQYATEIKSGKVIFSNSIPRNILPTTLAKYDLFIHAYNGSLDKSILEAVVCGLPVVTVNQEFLEQFGSWSGKPTPTLLDELMACLNKDSQEITSKVNIEQKTVRTNHSLENWIIKLSQVLSGN
jgi:glycosyltransferase involved in cell wall biosynthesis